MRTLASIILLATAPTIFANPTCNSDLSICSWDKMPKYNQRLVSDMHCGPTAASMGLDTILGNGSVPKADSWTQSSFVGIGEVPRIQNFGVKMSTTEGGTGAFGMAQYNLRVLDFDNLASNIDLPVLTRFNSDRLRSRLLQGQVDVLNYGHYKKECRGFLGVNICNYSRKGGHLISVAGFSNEGDTIKIKFNDPWGGHVKQYQLSQVPSSTWDFRPFSFHTYMLYQDGLQYKIVDAVMGIKVKN